jgi:hypothetical protein
MLKFYLVNLAITDNSMAQAVTGLVRSLADVRQYFGLSRTVADNFFPEWQTDLPELTATDCLALDRVRQRLRYQRELGQVGEGTVNAIVVSRLLELAGFYDPPFRLRAEQSIDIATNSNELRLRGRIDFLVVQEQFWQAVIESKETEFDIEVGIPQLLAYMMGAVSQPQVFGMVTNGNHYLFIKLQRTGELAYEFSDTFSLLSRANCLYPVLAILKKIGNLEVGGSIG